MATRIRTTTPNLRMQFWDSKLVRASAQSSLFATMGSQEWATFNPNTKSLPGGVISVVKFKPGVYRGNMGWKKALSGEATVGGTTSLVGLEEDLDFRSMAIYTQDYCKGVRSDGHNLDEHINEGYGITEEIVASLGQWDGDHYDLMCHQALHQTVCEDLTSAPTSLTQKHNRNWIIKGIRTNEQPVYSANMTTYGNNIGDALAQVPATIDGTWDVTFINNIHFALSSGGIGNFVRPIKPIKGDMYIVGVPAKGIADLSDLGRTDSMSSNLLNAFAKDYSALPWAKFIQPYKNLLLFQDDRAAVVSASGSTGSWTLTYNYMRHGETDSRTTASGTLYDLGWACGADGLIEGQYAMPHFETDSISYGQNIGTGVFAGRAMQSKVFDAESGAGATTLINESTVSIATYKFGGDL